MKIGVYNPYFDSLGGGERYCLTLASHWSKSHDVEVFWDEENILKKAKQRLGINLSRVKVVRNIFRGRNILKKSKETRKYDLIFFLSDGSIPFSFARHNILHFQSPSPFVKGKTLINSVKLHCYQAIVCNSQFTKQYIDREFGVQSVVIYPPVAVEQFRPLKKTNIILSVSRFTANKKQKEMVQFFRRLTKDAPLWHLHLVGGLLSQDRGYFDEVAREVKGIQTTLLPNRSFEELKDMYGHAAIYWHAAGFGEDEDRNPSAMEHFGITTVEAMAAGCIPIVYNAGGQREIVKDGINGFLWRTPQELLEKTKRVISDRKLQEFLRQGAMQRAKDFGEKKFCAAFDALLASIT